jgi:hypothetical protein
MNNELGKYKESINYNVIDLTSSFVHSVVELIYKNKHRTNGHRLTLDISVPVSVNIEQVLRELRYIYNKDISIVNKGGSLRIIALKLSVIEAIERIINSKDEIVYIPKDCLSFLKYELECLDTDLKGDLYIYFGEIRCLDRELDGAINIKSIISDTENILG